MSTYLDKILATTRRSVEERRHSTPRAVLERVAADHRPRGFAARLRAVSATGPAVIAELKKASPSKGLIRPHFDVEALARGLEQGGVAALSVLTEESLFQGSLANLATASSRVSIPCLRKDFILDEWQMLEARAYSADAVLLIAAVLSDGELRNLTRAAREHELDVLCEVHSAEELERVRGLGCDAIGVNARDLRTFETRLETALDLAAKLPEGAVRVAESGIHSAEDMERLRAAGFQAFLVGESLMRKPDPGQALKELIAAAEAAHGKNLAASGNE